jgi:hypothetical protein
MGLLQCIGGIAKFFTTKILMPWEQSKSISSTIFCPNNRVAILLLPLAPSGSSTEGD